MLRDLLPPVSKEELNREVEQTMSRFPPGAVDEDKFIEAIMANTYWAEAGELVVKELIFFDALNSYYLKKQVLLSDSDFDELKDQLAWEGSVAVSLTADEAKFVSAVSMNRKGTPMLTDAEYESLKARLLNDGSWITKRAPDPLEKMGLKTFLGYMHRELAGKS